MKVKLFAPKGYWLLTPEAKAEIVNGCGAGSARFDFVPDKILGVDISEACNIHDYEWETCEANHQAFKETNRTFHNNMYRLIDAKSKSKLLRSARRRIADLYYIMVGSPAGAKIFWEIHNDDETMNYVSV